MRNIPQNWNARGKRNEYDWTPRDPSLAQVVIWMLFAAIVIGGIAIAVF
jgi:hypothetical protein